MNPVNKNTIQTFELKITLAQQDATVYISFIHLIDIKVVLAA